MKKKTTKAKSGGGNKCTSTASAGAFKCVLDGKHEIHSTSTRRKSQHATWSLSEDGRVEVTTFTTAGKWMAEWFEDPPGEPRQPMPLKDEPGDPVADAAASRAPDAKSDEIDREIDLEFEDEVQNEITRPSRAEERFRAGESVLATELLVAREAKRRKKLQRAASKECNAVARNEDKLVCVKPKDHSGEHQSKRVLRSGVGSVATWVTNPDGSERGDVRAINDKGKAMTAVAVGSGGWASPSPSPSPSPSKRAAAPAPSSVASPALTKIGEHDVHPAAALFPMIGQAKWAAFVDDIRANGQRTKIVRIRIGASWLILDGRNRLRACIELKIEPKFRAFGDDPTDGDDPIAYVTSENVQRRHLDETELAYIGLELVPMYEEQARERQRAGVTATLREGDKGTAAEHAARAVGVSPRSMESALKVKRDAAPELLEASRDHGQVAVSAAAELSKLPKDKQREQLMKAGGKKITLGKARSIVNQEKKRAVVRKINAQQVTPMPVGPFRVIVVDWPWPYENSDQHEGSRGHIPYPSMLIEEALAMAPELDKLAHEDGCILGFWTTNAFMPDAVRIVEAWGFSWRTIRTWDKGRDGIGTWCRSRTEHLIIAERGDVEHTLNEVSTLIVGPRREHSRKPDEPMEVFERHCPGPCLEIFSREPRQNWATWGAETEKFATEAA